MQLNRSILTLTAAALLSLACGCGGSSTNVITSLTVSPTNISLGRGETQQVSVVATNSGGGTVTGKYFYSSSAPTLFTVSSGGILCAGTWDPTGVTCTPTTAASGSGTLTVTASDSHAAFTTTVYVHEKVDAIIAETPTPTVADCRSVITDGTTIQLTAHAYSNSATVCSSLGYSSAPCQIPDDSIGVFNWAAYNASVVSIDNTTTPPGQATPSAPGYTTMWAYVGNSSSPTKSPAVPFYTCPIVSLSIERADTSDLSSFSVDSGSYKKFYYTAVDSKGVSLKAPPLTWLVSNSAAFTFALDSTTEKTGKATGDAKERTTTLSVNCVSSGCNNRLDPVFSDFAVATVNGSASSPIVVAASTKSSTMQEFSDTTLKDSVDLPRKPNSFLMGSSGSYGLMGSDSGNAMTVAASSNSYVSIDKTNYVHVIATAREGSFAIASDGSNYYRISTGSSVLSKKLTLAGVTDATWSPAGNQVYIVNGTDTLYVEDIDNGTLTPYTLGGVIKSFDFINHGPIVYLAANSAGLLIRPFCDPDQASDAFTSIHPTMVRALPTGMGAIASDGQKLYYINTSNITQACPAIATDTIATLDPGLDSSDSIKKFYISPDDTRLVVVTTNGKLLVSTISDGAIGTPTVVSMANSATVFPSGAITVNSKYFYVGGSDGKVHRITLKNTTPSDDQQVDPKLRQADGTTVANPDLVQIYTKS